MTAQKINLGTKMFDCVPDEKKPAHKFIEFQQIRHFKHKRPRAGQLIAIFAPGIYTEGNKYCEVVKFEKYLPIMEKAIHYRTIEN